MPRAILSVSDKTGLVPLAAGLAASGFELISTGGTSKAIESAGLSVTAVAQVTGFPEMMDGRVKTLHPKLHGGILALRSNPEHMASARAHGIVPIDLVVVNLYPFAKAASNPAMPFDALVEEIDIGGPSLVRAAAKNFRDVLVVVSPSDYPAVLSELARTDGPRLEFRFELARKAFAHTGAYDSMIASTLAEVSLQPTGFERRQAEAPSTLFLGLSKVRDLRYGENPHQSAAWYADGEPAGFGSAQVRQGKELSYTNLLDLDAAARIVLEFTEPAAAVIKHTNPCGTATGATAADAYVRAREADPVAAFGGIVALNRPIDLDTANAIVTTFIEAVVAPAVADDAVSVLAKKANMRVLTADFSRLAAHAGAEFRSILGGVLVQRRDRVEEATSAWPTDNLRVVTKRQPTAEEWVALRFAWRVAAHVKSNAVIFTSADRTLAVGAGQMSRVDAVRVARLKADEAGVSLTGSAVASDAFFPFRDGLDAVAAAGASAVVQPGGSVRDSDLIEAADELGLTMVFTGRRHFRH